MQPLPTIHDESAVEAWWRAQRLDPHPLRRMRYALYQLRRSAAEALSELPLAHRRSYQEHLAVHCLTLEHQSHAEDGATKLLFRTAAGARLETVILRSPASDRASLCVSSQVGCAARCVFCATGQLPRVTQLTAAEILDQVVQANQLLLPEGRRVRNIVFMGMGEPLHNEVEVVRAAGLLFSRHHFNLSARRTTLSTVGIPEGMRRWARQFPRSPVALSLHSADPEIRRRLIPLAHHYSLNELRSALDDVVRIQQQPVLIEYLLLDGINNRAEDAVQLVAFMQGLSGVVNLIPMNGVDHAPEFRAPSQAAGNRFAAALRSGGLTVTFRHSRGREVDAACGQLANQPLRVG